MNSETVTLRDPAGTTKARILPGLGFNCFSFEVTSRGETVELLWADPGFASGAQRPTRSGIPILFPFAGRLRGNTFSYADREYQLDHCDDLGNAIHGFVFSRAWRVVNQSATHVVGEFQASQDDPSLLDRWPADFRISVTYRISTGSLRADIRLENPDRVPLPCGLGFHGYYRVPLAEGTTAGDCVVRVPVQNRWQLTERLPTGRREPAEMARRLAAGVPFAETQLDDVYGGVEYSNGVCSTSISDPGSGRKMVMAFDQFFRACVVFNPPHRQAICIEPYTTIPDAFSLAEQGVDTGLVIIEPGAALETCFEISLEDAAS